MNPSPLISVIIPVFNEDPTLKELVHRVLATNNNLEIILIDDGSSDNSVSVASLLIEENPDTPIRLIQLPNNSGKGTAVKTGLLKATGEIVIIQDADLEYDPQDYQSLISPILNEEADVVFGSRFLDSNSPKNWHSIANRMLTGFSNLFTRLRLTDMETCFKAIRIDVVRQLAPTLEQKRFGFEPEITAKISRQKLRVVEVPISYSPRSYAEGKKIRWRDGAQAIWCILRYGCFR